MKRLLIALCFVMAFCAVFSSCGEEQPPEIGSKTITLSETNITMEIGERLTLTAHTAPAAWKVTEILWYSSNPEIVSCEGGVLEARAAGSCTVKAYTADGISAATTVTVRQGISSLATVVTDELGKTVSYFDEQSGQVASSAVIKDYKLSHSYAQSSSTRLVLRVTVTLTGEKTYDVKGADGNTPVVFNAAVYLEGSDSLYDNAVLSEKDIKVGEEFSLDYTFTLYTDGKTPKAFSLSFGDETKFVDPTALVNFELRNTGDELSYKDGRTDKLLSVAVVDEYTVEYNYYPAVDGAQAYVYVTVKMSGRKIFDGAEDGNISPVAFDVSLYREDDIHCENAMLSSKNFTEDGHFNVVYSFKAGTDGSTVRSFYIMLVGD